MSDAGGNTGPGGVPGTVYETGGGVYAVALDSGEVIDASLRGRVKREERTGSRVVVGDRVRVRTTDGHWTIEEVEPRRTELVRRGRGGRTAKVLVANLDRILVVVALRDPPATPWLVDRLLVLVEASGMHPVVVLNKADLPGASDAAAELTSLYRSIGYRVVVVSAETGEGVEEFRGLVCSGLSALAGPSGVGKSSLLNAVAPDLDLRIGALSKKTGTGRHTTVGSRLLPLECGGTVADTPGFGDVGLWGVPPDELAACFPDFEDPAGGCRFRGCAHRDEPGCGVRAAVDAGDIAASRYESYLTLLAEAEEEAAR